VKCAPVIWWIARRALNWAPCSVPTTTAAAPANQLTSLPWVPGEIQKFALAIFFGPHRGHGTLSVYDCGLRADLIPAHQAVREPCEGANSGLNARLPADEDRNLVFVQSWRG